MELPWEGRKKVCINGPEHLTKMAATPIYGKSFKKLLLQNQKFYDLETLHASFGNQALHSLYYNGPDLTLFYEENDSKGLSGPVMGLCT